MKRFSPRIGSKAADWPFWTTRAVWTIGVVAASLLVILVAVYWKTWTRYAAAQDQLDARIERIDGVLRAGPEIDKRLALAQREAGPWLHPAGEAAQNALAQRLRELVVSNGGTLVSTQAVLAPVEDGKLRRIKLSATIAGEWEQLMGILAGIQGQLPPFWVRSSVITRDGRATNDVAHPARLVLQLDVPVAPEKVPVP